MVSTIGKFHLRTSIMCPTIVYYLEMMRGSSDDVFAAGEWALPIL